MIFSSPIFCWLHRIKNAIIVFFWYPHVHQHHSKPDIQRAQTPTTASIQSFLIAEISKHPQVPMVKPSIHRHGKIPKKKHGISMGFPWDFHMVMILP